MLSNKVMQYTVLIKDPNDQLMDQHTKVMDVLKQTFENKCFRSCLIKEVTKIHRLGHLKFISSRQDSIVKCDVQFEVRVLQFKKNQIIHGCVINKKAENGTVICANDDVAIYIRASKILQGARKGDTIIARAGMFRYKIARPKISVNGFPFIAIFNNVGVIYNITPISSKFLQELLDELNKRMERCKKYKEYDYFRKLLFPCKLTTKATRDKKFSEFKKVPIGEIFQTKEVFITLPDHVDLAEGVVLSATDIDIGHVLNPTSKDVWVKDSQFIINTQYDSNKIIGQFIYQMIEYFNEIETFCKLYDTDEQMKKYIKQFDIYEKSKR